MHGFFEFQQSVGVLAIDAVLVDSHDIQIREFAPSGNGSNIVDPHEPPPPK